MHPIEKILTKLAKVRRKKGEDEQDWLQRLTLACADKIPTEGDNGSYNSIPQEYGDEGEAAQKWMDASAAAYSDDEEIPPFEDFLSEEDEEDEEPEEDEEDEEPEEPEEPEDPEDPEEPEDPEDPEEPEEPEDEPEEEDPVSTKKKTANRKGTAKKTTRKGTAKKTTRKGTAKKAKPSPKPAPKKKKGEGKQRKMKILIIRNWDKTTQEQFEIAENKGIASNFNTFSATRFHVRDAVAALAAEGCLTKEALAKFGFADDE